MSEPITVSEMTAFLGCARRYYLRYVAMIAPEQASDALRFGTAWHAALEARAGGADYEAALGAALTAKGCEVSSLMAAQLSALLAGYYRQYGAQDSMLATLHAEVPFTVKLAKGCRFTAAGKIDGLGTTHDGAIVLVEHKTCAEDIGDGSDYWMRLRFNNQLMQYVDAARSFGWQVERVIYDVCRKPSVLPRESVPVLDEQGRKQVVGTDGLRVFKANGEPKLSCNPDNGERFLTAPETLEQYSERLLADIGERPEWYYARREVTVLDADLDEFRRSRLTFVKNLVSLRALSRKCAKPADAYMRNVSALQCRGCEFRGPCLDGVPLDGETLPNGWRKKTSKHEELENKEAT